MPGVCRIGDIGAGICVCHISPIPMTGILITGVSSKNIENSAASTISNIMLGFCGHIGIMISGSSSAFIENQSVVRVGDSFAGCFSGVTITGASSCNAGD